jgi:formylglycine-generating enzyme required for sulfatase activity
MSPCFPSPLAALAFLIAARQEAPPTPPAPPPRQAPAKPPPLPPLAPTKLPDGWEAVGEERGAAGLPKKARDPRSGITFLLVEPGTYWRGTTKGKGKQDEHPRHRTQITKPFYLGEFEVTVAQWRRFVEATKFETDAERGAPFYAGGDALPGGWTWGTEKLEGGESENKWLLDARATWRSPLPLREHAVDERHPVTQLSWQDCVAFCEHFGLRLPTEAEWEYAARAGTSEKDWKYWWGDEDKEAAGKGNFADRTPRDDGTTWINALPIEDGFWGPAPVGTFAPNPWGFHDILGNASEWCADWYEARSYRSFLKGVAIDPAGPEKPDENEARVARGGSFDGRVSANVDRCANRLWIKPGFRADDTGFRVAKTP